MYAPEFWGGEPWAFWVGLFCAYLFLSSTVQYWGRALLFLVGLILGLTCGPGTFFMAFMQGLFNRAVRGE